MSVRPSRPDDSPTSAEVQFNLVDTAPSIIDRTGAVIQYLTLCRDLKRLTVRRGVIRSNSDLIFGKCDLGSVEDNETRLNEMNGMLRTFYEDVNCV